MDLHQRYLSCRPAVHYRSVWKWFGCSLGSSIFICMRFSAQRAAVKVGKRKHYLRAPVASFLTNGWAGSRDGCAPRILWAGRAGHHTDNGAAVSPARFNVIFLFSFHSQRTGSKTLTLLACCFRPFLSKPLKNVWACGFCSGWKNSNAEEDKRFHFLLNLSWAEKSNLKLLSLGSRESLPGCLCQERPCHVTHLQVVDRGTVCYALRGNTHLNNVAFWFIILEILIAKTMEQP